MKSIRVLLAALTVAVVAACAESPTAPSQIETPSAPAMMNGNGLGSGL